MIRGYCVTNLDEGGRYRWPGQFVSVPRIGERVQCLKHSGPHPEYSLKVVSVTHTMQKDPTYESSFDPEFDVLIPIVRVELNN